MKAILLAAGYATRLYPLTRNTPKALLDIAGRPMIDWFTENLAHTGKVDSIVLVSNHRYADVFRRWADAAAERWPQMPVQVLDDGTAGEDERLGAVGDIAFALREAGIDEDVLVAASDNFLTFPLDGMLEDFERHGRDTLLAAHMEDWNDRKGMAVAVLDADGRIVDLEEKPQEPKSDTVLYAVYLYRRETLPLIGRFLAEGNNGDSPGRFPAWLYSRQELRAWFATGECIDIGTAAHLEAVRKRFPDEQAVRRELLGEIR